MIFCPLYSGSSGNSIFVSSDNTKILVDAGMPGKSIDKALTDIGEDGSKIDAIFITHEHSDHIKGAGIFSRKYDIPIYANEGTWEAMSSSLGKVKEHNIKVIEDNYVSIKDIDIVSFDTPHDAAAPCGYSIHSNGKKACIATDIGYFSDNIKNELANADVILLESNHDVEMVKFGPYPYPLKKRILSDVGHLSNEACGKAITELLSSKPKHIILGHLSNTNNYPDLAYQTVINVLQENSVVLDKDVFIKMAKRDMPSSYTIF